MFQSTPGIAAGRINMQPAPADPTLVSIHARHRCRANHVWQAARDMMFVFQSTPGIAAGRIGKN